MQLLGDLEALSSVRGRGHTKALAFQLHFVHQLNWRFILYYGDGRWHRFEPKSNYLTEGRDKCVFLDLKQDYTEETIERQAEERSLCVL